MPHHSTIDGLSEDALRRSSHGPDTDINAAPLLFNAKLHRPAIPNYEVLEELGRGGMGVVYKARDARLKREVAIKMLLDPEFASPEQRLRFKIEAEAVAQLHHPNIVQVHELGELAGTTIAHPYMVLEYVEGPTLFRYMRQRTFTEREVAALLITLARAIQHAHDHGLIHRDLKPANILIQLEDVPESGSTELNRLLDFTPKITDFGLVKALVFDGEGRRDLTRPELMVGTPQYMAPEQANPSPHALSCSVDIYSLGVIFYEMLTGQLPFDDQDILRMLMEVQTQEAPSPRKVKPAVSVDLATICMKCLNKLPEQRYHSAAALADDLSRFLNNEPIQARPLSEWQRVIKWAKRHPMVASLVGLLFGVISVGLVVIGVFWRQAEAERQNAESESREASWARDEARKAAITAKDAAQDAKKQEQAAQSALYYNKVAQADLLLRQGQLARPISILNSAHRAVDTNDVRSWEWYYLRQQCNTMEYIDVQSKHYVYQVAYHPRKDLLVSIEGAELFQNENPWDFPARLMLHQGDDDKHMRVYKVAYQSPVPLRYLYLAKDGKYAIVANYKNQLTAIDIDEAAEGSGTKPIPLPVFQHHTVASQAGQVLLWNEGGNTLTVFDVELQKKVDEIPLPSALHVANISSDGKRIVYGLKNHEVTCYDRASKKVLWSKTFAHPARALRLNATGQEMVCLLSNENMLWENVEKSQTLLQASFPGYDYVKLSDDGTALAVIIRGDPGDVVHVYRQGASGQVKPLPLALVEHRGNIIDVSFSQDGQQLLTFGSDMVVRLWDINEKGSGHCLFRHVGHQAQVMTAALSPHTKTIASGSMDANIMYWRTDYSLTRDRLNLSQCLEVGGEWISNYRFIAGTNLLATFEHQRGNLALIDMTTRKMVKKTLLAAAANNFRAPRYDNVFSPDGKLLAVLNKLQNQVLVYDTLEGKLLWTTPTKTIRYFYLAFSGDNKRLLSAGHFPLPEGNKPVPFLSGYQVWDVTEQKLVHEGKVDGYSHSWNINHDGTRLVAGLRTKDDRVLTLLDVTQGGKEVFRKKVKYRMLVSVAFSPDGKWIAGVNFEPERNNVALWNSTTGEMKWEQFSNFESVDVAFTRDSKRVLHVGYLSDISMHETESGRDVLSFPHHGKPRQGDYALNPRIVFNQDESMMVTHSWDGNLSIWHAFSKEAYDKNPLAFEKVVMQKDKE
jgi:eukaryotic-like serine/threonine-protein kinase